MVFPTPGHIEGNEVMSAGMKEHIHPSFSQSFQVSGYEDLIRNVTGEILQLYPGAARIQNAFVEIGTEMSARKPTFSSGLSPQFIPRFFVIETKGGVPDRGYGGMHGRHSLVVKNRHRRRGSVFRSAGRGDFALFEMILFRVCGGDGAHQGGGPCPVLNFEFGIEALGKSFLTGLGQCSLAIGPRFLNHGDD